MVRKTQPPDAVKQRGSYVALSDDEGETWHIKKLDMAVPSEIRQMKVFKKQWSGADHDYSTIGYSAAVQAQNGVIHLITSMNHPSQHFELNEAWILSDKKEPANQEVEGSRARVLKHKERYPGGKTRVIWSSRTGANGNYVLHGPQVWYFQNGRKKYEVTYRDGKKIGEESLWDAKGNLKWRWNRGSDGTGVWTHYWPKGQKKIESGWRDFKAEGPATHWDEKGNVTRKVVFKDGVMID